jgi:hypothetical protein
MPPTIGTLLAEYPEFVVAIAIAARAILAWQRQVTYSEYRTYHALKRGLFPIIERLSRVRILPVDLPLVHRKGYHEDGEYLATVDGTLRSVTKRLKAGGGSLHLLNSLKVRATPVGDQYSSVHVRWGHADGTQTEAYLFPAVDGDGVDVYAHSEASPEDVIDHLDGPQPDGDPHGVVREALGLA